MGDFRGREVMGGVNIGEVAIWDEDRRTWGELVICWGYLDCSGGVLMCGWRDSCHQGEYVVR